MTHTNPPQPKKPLSHQWTPEKLAAQGRKSVEVIRDRAARHGVTDLVDLCERDRAQRPKKMVHAAKAATPRRSASDVVTGYHFVCEQGRGVTEAGTGRFSSGSWVVAEANVPKSLQVGAYLALHASKESSYRQGRIVDFRRSPRDMVAQCDTGARPQIDEGIEFLVEETGNPYEWVGSGSGEKGYRWSCDSSADAGVPGNQGAAA